MYVLLIVIQIIVAASLVTLVLLQHGKGADAGAAFGSGASATVFGAKGSANFLSRTTAILAVVFFGNSLLLSSPLVLGDRRAAPTSVVEKVTAPLAEEPPAEAASEPAQETTAPADLPDLPPVGSSTSE